MIPKKIHYVWVGTAEKPDSVIKCIESWKKYCPDYEIIEWGNEEFEKIKNKYARQAFENKKWAFVSDYIRLYALYNHGGIYLDTDVEITQNIDRFLVHDFVSGFEKWKDIYSPVTAFMGAKQEHKIIKDLLEYYLTHEFETKDGLDMEPNTKRISNYFMKNFGLKKPYDGTKTIELCENCMIYPYYYFCTPEEGKENFTIHHFNASWLDNYDRKKLFRLGNFRISRIKLRKGKNPDIYSPVTAFMGAKQEHKIIKDFLEYYLTHEFETKDGLDMKPNTQRFSEYFMKNFGLKKPYDGTKTVELCENCMIYPYYYFCTPEEGKENFAIHHFNGSWVDSYDRKKLFRLGNFRVSRIKLRKGKNPDILPVLSSEKLIKIFKLNANKSIMITKKVR